MRKLSVQDLTLRGKLVLVRCDFNVPLKDGRVQNDKRIQASLKTIHYLQRQGARTVLLSHLGRPRGKLVEELRLLPVAERLAKVLNTKIHYTRDCIGEESQSTVQNLAPGEIALLENLRFYQEETQNDEGFARKLAYIGGKKANFFINDAFGTAHRSHASTVGLAKSLKSAMGYLMQSEIENLGKIRINPQRPLLSISGGAKVSDKISLIQSLLERSDHLLIGGAMAFTFLRAKGYGTGKSFVEEKLLERVAKLLKEYKKKIHLPTDFMCTRSFDLEKRKIGRLRSLSYKNISEKDYALDIGPQSTLVFQKFIADAKTIFWNGPMGVFELAPTAQGSLAVAQAVGERSRKGAFSLVGGGDSIAALSQAGSLDKISYISTGGGASLQFLKDPNLPGISALNDARP